MAQLGGYVQLLKRPKIIKLAILTALICGHGAVAQSEINSADSDLRQIRETFNVPDDDHGVLKVSKRVYESDEYGTSVTGIYVRVPYFTKINSVFLKNTQSWERKLTMSFNGERIQSQSTFNTGLPRRLATVTLAATRMYRMQCM